MPARAGLVDCLYLSVRHGMPSPVTVLARRTLSPVVFFFKGEHFDREEKGSYMYL